MAHKRMKPRRGLHVYGCRCMWCGQWTPDFWCTGACWKCSCDRQLRSIEEQKERTALAKQAQ